MESIMDKFICIPHSEKRILANFIQAVHVINRQNWRILKVSKRKWIYKTNNDLWETAQCCWVWNWNKVSDCLCETLGSSDSVDRPIEASWTILSDTQWTVQRGICQFFIYFRSRPNHFQVAIVCRAFYLRHFPLYRIGYTKGPKVLIA